MLVSSPIIVALDYSTMRAAMHMADQLDPALCRVKVGKELFTAEGPSIVEALVNRGFDVFLDLKFHDIPNTASKAVVAAARMGVWMVNVHASGGKRMMRACRDALNALALDKPPLLIAVTVLTSMEQKDLQDIGVDKQPQAQVVALSQLAKSSGMDGVVCSAEEAEALKSTCGKEFVLVTPGIRPKTSTADDQRRIVTPHEAISQGSDYLVIGRPITQAYDPVATIKAIIAEL